MEAPYRRRIGQSLLQRIREWVKTAEANPALLDDEAATLPVDYRTLEAIHEFLMRSCLLGMDTVGKKRRKENFADPLLLPDAPIEALPFEEAVSFLQTKIPLTKEAYYELDDKLRFRAFTVGRLNDGDAVNRVKGIIRTNLEQGGTITDFYKMTDAEILNGMGFGTGNMSYWETVYRTNEASVHNAGRAMAFEADPPVALELVGITDARQTDICYHLTNPPFIRPYDDPVWQTLWPPFHFNCRTMVRGIYDASELEEYGGAENVYSWNPDVKPQDGFGGYPLDKESYWRLTPEMVERAKDYRIDGEIAVAAQKLGMNNYALKILDGYEIEYVPQKGSGYVLTARGSKINDDEMELAKLAADAGHQIYFTPINKEQNIKNPDNIMDNAVAEIKHVTSKNPAKVGARLQDAVDQKVTTVLMQVNDIIYPEKIHKKVEEIFLKSAITRVIVRHRGSFININKKG